MKNIENTTGSALCADPAVIAPFFREITQEWRKYPNQVGIFEIRCLGENQRTASQIFAPGAIDAAGVDGIGTFTGPHPDMVVTTGVQPHRRLHAYWRLHEPCFDLAKWRNCQKQLAERLDTDTSITNPSRIMRVAGTVSYPNEHKQQKGYMQELVTLKVDPEAWP